jgi:hypothetical protein
VIGRLWSWIAASSIGRAVAGIGLAVVTLIGLRSRWRSEGAAAERERLEDEDRERAQRIREAADGARDRAADDGRDVDERLRDHGRLRD